ncbi:hypothetical protein NA57DRAFT_48632, partial [Rhizodiscina lignyota]
TDKTMALSLSRSGTSLSDTAVSNGHETPTSWRRGGSLSRRRKVSITELGPAGAATAMATVQEAGFDSPTIPGRPPLRQVSFDTDQQSPRLSNHERSISAPQSAVNQYSTGDFTNPRAPVPIPHRKYSIDSTQRPHIGSKDVPKTKGQNLNASKSLSPIFSPGAPGSGRKESGATHAVILLEDDLPQPLKLSGQKPTAHREAVPTAQNIPLKIDTSVQRQCSPQEFKPEVPPKTPPSTHKTPKTPKTPSRPWPIKHSASMGNLRALPGQVSVPADALRPSVTSPETASNAHSRNASDTSILERGRPFKRSGSRKKSPKKSPVLDAASPRSDDGNWRLPNGLRPCEAVTKLPDSEKEALRKQATGQAEQFEILGARNVASLSRELRALDERCEYLRSTHKSLRAGRLKLHNRMITYLKSELQFSKESLLKQEEALIELDKSIDDWILKLEQAENRRLRVRQKLLEHIAATMALNPVATSPQKAPVGPSTPPGSPIKSRPQSPSAPVNRRDVESIKIYADGQVLSLFSDIEQAVTKMCEAC